ncbi:MAG: CPBP family intramembrane metalloprotease [Chromatiales bacterium]|nr:MAG: CPBP family intramembrane metalloprotease [Chromatiales bacterium]
MHSSISPAPEDNRQSWSGIWSGLIWFVIGYVAISIAQLVAIVIAVAAETATTGAELGEDRVMELAIDGDTLALSLVLALPAVLGLLAIAVKNRRNEPLFEFLGIRSADKASILRWSVYAIGLLITIAVLDELLGRPPVPEFVQKAYGSADNLLLFWIGIALMGPITEELLFRGYIARVWANSRLGPVGTTVFLSMLWAATHLQYDLYDMAWVFILGTLLCLSRLQTNSILPAVIIHIGWNSAAMVATAYYHGP